MNNSDIPLLSVCIITYNHVKYIRQAIESVLLQKVNFAWEIIIADDYSSDGTREILLEYKKKYPELITLILQEKNVGPAKNWEDLITRPRSKYISYFEGDDYWIDERKLQKQVDFFEANANFGMSFHAVEILAEYSTDYKYKSPPKEILRFKDLLFNHYIPSCSLVFRRELMPNPFPDWFLKSKMGDIPLELMIADQCLTKYFPDRMAVYRKHRGSLTHDVAQIKAGRRAYINLYKNLNQYFQYKYWLSFSFLIGKTYLGGIKDIFRKF